MSKKLDMMKGEIDCIKEHVTNMSDEVDQSMKAYIGILKLTFKILPHPFVLFCFLF